MPTQWIFGVWVGGHGLQGSVPIRYPVTLGRCQTGPSTHMLLLFLLPSFSPLCLHTSVFSLLPLSSLEPKVEPSSVEVENSESLFLKTSDSDPAPQHLSLCLYFNSLSPSVCTYPSSSSSIPPSLSPLPVPEGRWKEASQSHQCDLI